MKRFQLTVSQDGRVVATPQVLADHLTLLHGVAMDGEEHFVILIPVTGSEPQDAIVVPEGAHIDIHQEEFNVHRN